MCIEIAVGTSSPDRLDRSFLHSTGPDRSSFVLHSSGWARRTQLLESLRCRGPVTMLHALFEPLQLCQIKVVCRSFEVGSLNSLGTFLISGTSSAVFINQYGGDDQIIFVFSFLHARHRHMCSPVFVRTSPWCCRCRYARFLERRGVRGSSQRTERILRHNLVERQVKVSVLVHFWQIPLGSMAQPFFCVLAKLRTPQKSDTAWCLANFLRTSSAKRRTRSKGRFGSRLWDAKQIHPSLLWQCR